MFRLSLHSFGSLFPSPTLLALGSLALLSPLRGQNFPDLPGWQRGGLASYGPENLHVPINGASDLFLRYGFMEMRSTQYLSPSGEVSIEVYRHATPLQTFGIYSQSRAGAERYLELGDEGHGGSDYLFFFAGCHYVEMRSSRPGPESELAMQALAQALSEQWKPSSGLPAEFALFPVLGRRPRSEVYLAKDVLGYACLSKALEVTYETPAGLRLLVSRLETRQAVKATLGEYLKANGIDSFPEEGRAFQLTDRYHGRLWLCWRGSHLAYAVGGEASLQEGDRVETLCQAFENHP